MEETIYYGALSLIPIFVTIGLVVWSKNVCASLFAGVLSGALIVCHGSWESYECIKNNGWGLYNPAFT